MDVLDIPPLPAYDQATWQKLYREVRERQLTVNFNLTGVLDDVTTGKPVVKSVDVTVNYPTRMTGNTFTLRPGDKAGYVYEAPGHFVNGVFDPQYEYTYTVYFADGNRYQSEPARSTQTIVNILPADVGIRQVTFIGSQIPFAAEGEDGVAQLLNDFFFQQPAGRPNKIDTRVMTENGPAEGAAIRFQSFFPQRITDEYCYRLTYVMRDSKQYVVAPQQAFGSRNADRVIVVNPFSVTQEFMLNAFIPEHATRRIARVTLGCSYRDEPNHTDLRHSWHWRPNQKDDGFLFADDWQFVAFPDQTAARFVMDGTVYFSDGKRLPLNNLTYQARNNELSLEPGTEPYSVRIDGKAIDWEKVVQVEVTLYQYDGTPAPEAAIRLLRHDALDDERRSNYLQFNLQGPKNGTGETQRYYPVTRTATATSVVFFWAAEYLHADGSVTHAGEVDVKDRFVVTLPPDGTKSEPAIQVRELSFGDTVATRS